MKYFANFLRRFDFIFILILFSIITCLYSFTSEITYNDELWNFQNIYKMYNGFTIYNDCNVIITPLFFTIGELLLKIFSPNLITFKFYNVIIYSLLFTFIYILFRILNISFKKSLLFSSIILASLTGTISGGANYNCLSILFVIVGIIFLIKSRKNILYLFANGVVIFLTIFSKQNIGVYYLLGVILSEHFINKNYIITIKRILFQFIPASILSIITFIIMHKYNILFDFLNYAILGMKEFSLKNINFVDFWILVILLLILLVYFFSMYIIKKKFISDSTSLINLKLLLCISIPLTLMVYPIFNLYHFKFVLIFVFILFTYVIDKLLLTPILDEKVYNILSITVSILIFLIIGIYPIINLFISGNIYNYYDSNHPYYLCYISDENRDKINTVCNYIENQNKKGTDVIVLSDQAALYMVPLKQSHNYFDLPFVGNFGKDGEDGVIENIKSSKNSQFLIVTDEEDMFWQESKKVREYIINNLKNIGEISDFYIYE